MKLSWTGSSGLNIVGDGYGDASAPGVILLHGGGQTRHAWGGTAEALAKAGFYAVSIDQRGHGESDWDPEARYGLDAFKSDLVAIARTFSRPPAVVGASLGGLAALLAQGESEERIAAAVVMVDVAHRLEREGVMRIVQFMVEKSEEGFASLEEVADAVAAYLPHRQRPKDFSGLKKNLRLGADGRYRWHWDPKFIGPHQANDPNRIKARLVEATKQLNVPALVVRGRLSDVLSEDAAQEFIELAPNAEYVDVGAAAHMIAGDKNDVFTDAVAEFLARVA